MKKIKWSIFVCSILLLTICFAPFVVSGEGAQSTQANTLYSDFLNSKDSLNYEVRTSYGVSSNYLSQKANDIYVYSTDLIYHERTDNLFGEPNIVERIVLLKPEGNESFLRTSMSMGQNQDYQVPFFRTDDPDIYSTIMTFFDNPLFHLENYISSSLSGISVNISSLSPETRAYLIADLQQIKPNLHIFSSGSIEYTFLSSGTAITGVQIDYDGLFSGTETIIQTVSFSLASMPDVETLLSGAVNLSDLSDWENTTLPKIAQDQSVSFENSHESMSIQYCFLRIETAGEYVFTETTDNPSLNLRWCLYDLKLHQYRPILTGFQNSSSSSGPRTVYLDPGYYFLFMMPRSMNTNQASLTYSLKNNPDDYVGTYNPNISEISETTTISFQSDDPTDIDAFLITGDYDVLIITADWNISFAMESWIVSRNNIQLSKIILNPGVDFLLYFSCNTFGTHRITLSFYSYSDDPLPRSEAPVIDLYDDKKDANEYVAYPFAGGKDTFAFDIREDSVVLAYCSQATVNIYRSNGEMVSSSQNGPQYALTAGRYYIVISFFKGQVASFVLSPEPIGENIHVLSPVNNRIQIQGFISDTDDIDIYEISFSSDVTVIFENTQDRFIVVGVDNPTLIQVNFNSQDEYKFTKGTYFLTFPKLQPSSQVESSSYHVVIDIMADNEEVQ